MDEGRGRKGFRGKGTQNERNSKMEEGRKRTRIKREMRGGK